MSADQSEQKAGTLKQVFIGAVLGGVLIWILFRSFYCFYTFQEPAFKFLVWGVALLYGFLGNRFLQARDELTNKIFNYLFGGVLAATLVMLATTLLVQDLTRNFCVRDFEVLKSMIETEGQAVIAEDIDSIHSLFTAGAVVSNLKTDEDFLAYTHYSIKFATEDHCAVTHSDYLVTEYSSEQVTLTTSSMGSYGPDGAGCTLAYSNPPGSDEWVFRKTDGEWKILHFAFHKQTE